MKATTRQALIEAISQSIQAQQAVLAILVADMADHAPVKTPAKAKADPNERRRAATRERVRRYRERKAGVVGGVTEGVTDTPKTVTESVTEVVESVTATGENPSRTHARSSFSEIQNSEKNQNPQSPPVGGGVLFDVTAATGTAAATGDARQSPPVASGAPIAALPVASAAVGGARRRRADRQAVVDVASVEQPVREVWDAYREAVGDRVVLTVARLELIRARLAGWTVEELTDCVRGYGASRFHQGENDRGRRYVDLELWFRDASHIESGKRMWADRGRAKPVGSGAGSAGSSAGARSPTAPLPLNGIEAKWDKWFQDNPEGEYRFPRVGSAAGAAEGAGR